MYYLGDRVDYYVLSLITILYCNYCLSSKNLWFKLDISLLF